MKSTKNLRRTKLQSIRKTLRKPAAKWYVNELQIEADYKAAPAWQLTQIWRCGMMLLINLLRLLSSDEILQIFISKNYPQNNMLLSGENLRRANRP